MNTYYSTFISGFSKVIEEAIRHSLDNLKIVEILDGLIIYETSASIDAIKNIPFFNNSFYLIDYKSSHPRGVIVSPPPRWGVPVDVIKNKRSFRVIISRENELISIPKKQLVDLEQYFSGHLKMDVDRANPDIEVWFLERSEGYSFWGIRLTKKASTEKYLQKGELRPELSWLLCYLSEPNSEDIFLDPFAGYGSIPIARTMFPYKELTASDNDLEKVCNLQAKVAPIKHRFIVKKWDAEELPFKNSSINKIVTDPPWGHFEDTDVHALYQNVIKEFARILKSDGIFVVLTAQKELMKEILETMSNEFELLEEYHILVSGKKSGIYKIRRV